MRPRALRFRLALIGWGGILAAQLIAPAAAKADDVTCLDQFWLTLGSTTRTLCDGPILADGSWKRGREFWTPAHWVPLRTTCSGYYFISCTSTGGYFQPRTSKGVEFYIVTPDTVLGDEPGHLA